MDADAVLMWIGNATLLSVIPALILFVFYYGIKANWRAHRIGRALMYMTSSLLVVCSLFALTLVFGDWPFKSWIRIIAYGCVSFTIWRMAILTVRIIRHNGDLAEKEGGTQ